MTGGPNATRAAAAAAAAAAANRTRSNSKTRRPPRLPPSAGAKTATATTAAAATSRAGAGASVAASSVAGKQSVHSHLFHLESIDNDGGSSAYSFSLQDLREWASRNGGTAAKKSRDGGSEWDSACQSLFTMDDDSIYTTLSKAGRIKIEGKVHADAEAEAEAEEKSEGADAFHHGLDKEELMSMVSALTMDSLAPMTKATRKATLEAANAAMLNGGSGEIRMPTLEKAHSVRSTYPSEAGSSSQQRRGRAKKRMEALLEANAAASEGALLAGVALPPWSHSTRTMPNMIPSSHSIHSASHQSSSATEQTKNTTATAPSTPNQSLLKLPEDFSPAATSTSSGRRPYSGGPVDVDAVSITDLSKEPSRRNLMTQQGKPPSRKSVFMDEPEAGSSVMMYSSTTTTTRTIVTKKKKKKRSWWLYLVFSPCGGNKDDVEEPVPVPVPVPQHAPVPTTTTSTTKTRPKKPLGNSSVSMTSRTYEDTSSSDDSPSVGSGSGNKAQQQQQELERQRQLKIMEEQDRLAAEQLLADQLLAQQIASGMNADNQSQGYQWSSVGTPGDNGYYSNGYAESNDGDGAYPTMAAPQSLDGMSTSLLSFTSSLGAESFMRKPNSSVYSIAAERSLRSGCSC